MVSAWYTYPTNSKNCKTVVWFQGNFICQSIFELHSTFNLAWTNRQRTINEVIIRLPSIQRGLLVHIPDDTRTSSDIDISLHVEHVCIEKSMLLAARVYYMCGHEARDNELLSAKYAIFVTCYEHKCSGWSMIHGYYSPIHRGKR